jgi:ADP-ribose pyrophosphatase YjhB (NUDIX family)
MIKELTASVFIVRPDDAGEWQTALIWHPRLGCWLPAGGHVESGETTAQAAIRKAAEGTGLAVTLVPGPALPFPAGFPHRRDVPRARHPRRRQHQPAKAHNSPRSQLRVQRDRRGNFADRPFAGEASARNHLHSVQYALTIGMATVPVAGFVRAAA